MNLVKTLMDLFRPSALELAHPLRDAPFKIIEDNSRVWAHLFENKNVGVPRGLYWCLQIDLGQIDYSNETWGASIAFEWLELSVEDSPQVFSSNSRSEIECSFYMFEHTPAESWKLIVYPQSENGDYFVEFDAVIDFPGVDNDPCKNLKIGGKGFLKLGEIIVIPDNLFPKPDSPESAKNMIAPYFRGIEHYVYYSQENEDGGMIPDFRKYTFKWVQPASG